MCSPRRIQKTKQNQCSYGKKKNKPPLARENLAEKMGSTQGSYGVYINEPRANRDG